MIQQPPYMFIKSLHQRKLVQTKIFIIVNLVIYMTIYHHIWSLQLFFEEASPVYVVTMIVKQDILMMSIIKITSM